MIENPYQGIYYLSGNEILFPTQIIVTRELLSESHTCLRVLTQKLQAGDIHRFFNLMKNLESQQEHAFAASILEVFAAANR